MNAENLAVWFLRQNHKVVRTKSSYWFDQGPRTLQAFPFHWQIEPGEGEIIELLKSGAFVGLRYSTPIKSSVGCISYHITYEGETYELVDLPKHARYEIKKGYHNANMEQISWSMMATSGWKARYDTLVRQGRTSAETERWWTTICEAAHDIDGLEAWAAIEHGEIVGSIIGFQCDDIYSILYQQSMTNHLTKGVNSALTHHVTRNALGRPSVKQVFYGLQSLDAPASVDLFKARLNFKFKAVRQRIVFHPWLRSIITNRHSQSLLPVASMIFGSHSVGKIRGMIAFHRRGNLPLSDQPLPEVLVGFHDNLAELK